MKIFNLFANKVFILIVSVCFLVYFTFTMIGQSNTMKDNQEILENYRKGIAEQQQLQKELEEESRKIGSDEYNEQIARERLGLCKSNEKIFVDGKGE